MELEPNVDCTLSRNPADDQLGFCYLFLRNDSLSSSVLTIQISY